MTRPISIRKNPLFIIGLSLFAGQAIPAAAAGYGVYDARSMAMGGTGVAIGNGNQAAYYNPALLALGDGDKNRRTYMPSLTLQTSTAIDAAVSAMDDNLDSKLSQTINLFNSQATMANAEQAAGAAEELRTVLNKVANRDLTVDGFAGFSASNEGEHKGHAFFVGVRTIGLATSKVTPTDLDILDQYIDAMGQLAAGVSPAVVLALHHTLLLSENQFSDPIKRLQSSADMSALVIGEWGMALANEFTFWQQPVQLGVTPKLMRIDAYRDSIKFNNTDLNNLNQRIDNFSETKTSLNTLNADLGIATLFADHYRVSLAVKDLFAKELNVTQVSGANVTVRLRPHSRLGLGYISDDLTLGLDYDLHESTTIAREYHNQELRLGAEYKLSRPLALRLGYSHDLVSPTANPISGGIGYQGESFIADIAYTRSRDMTGASLQMGWTF